jgi:hypothetical protein
MNAFFKTILFFIIGAHLAFLMPFCYSQNTIDSIKFSHKTHIQDAGAVCVDCHSATATNNGGPRKMAPSSSPCSGTTSCGECHKDQYDDKDCAFCHTSVDHAVPFKKRQLLHKNFSHKVHTEQKAECSVCHIGVDAIGYATEKSLPTMDICYTCHNDKKAVRDCKLCHDDLQKIKPESHRSLWFVKEEHGRDAKTNTLDCKKCHQQNYCDQCHFGQLSTRIHNPNYAFTHGIEAKRHDKDCMLCHEVQNSCERCHAGKR